MIIEVTGTSTRNKGAELMLIAIADHFRKYPEVQLAVDQFFGTYPARAKYGLLQKVSLNGWGRSRLAVSLMPGEFRRAFGLVQTKDVDVILDASGFAFGDQHPPERTIRFAERVEKAKAAGKKVILLPQALGPFEDSTIRNAFSRIVNATDLVIARDDRSMQYVLNVAGTRDHLKQAPDFTNLVKPDLPVKSNESSRVCIVPNQRMLEKTENRPEREAYIPLIGRCIRIIAPIGLKPVLLLHGEEDHRIAGLINRETAMDLPIYRDKDPVTLKKYLGESHLVIGSRFHSLVGALSQGVPAIGTSWSHKYQMLFKDYGCPQMLLNVPSAEDHLIDIIEECTGPARQALVTRIKNRASELEEKSRDMWQRVDVSLGLLSSKAEEMTQVNSPYLDTEI